MEDQIVLTYSDINQFVRCKRAWYWTYYKDVRPAEKLYGPMPLGTRVHKALEYYYKTGDDPMVRFEELAAADVAYVEAYGEGWEADKLYEDIIVGRLCVGNHQQWLRITGADHKYDVVSVEEMQEAEIIPGVIIRTKVDVKFRDRDTGFLYNNDIKTDGSWMGSPWDYFERSWQHSIYDIVSRRNAVDEIVDGSMYTVIKKAKRASSLKGAPVERRMVPGTRKTWAAKERQLEMIATDIKNLIHHLDAYVYPDGAYPTPTRDCQWCPVKVPCTLMDESTEAAIDYVASNFVVGGRHARYEET